MVIFGTIGLFTRYVPVSSGELALYRAVLAILFIGGFLLITRRSVPLAALRSALPWLLLSGAALGVNWMLLFEAYRHTTVSVATLSYYFAPVLVTAACPLLFREKLTKRQLFCFLMSTAGLILLVGPSGVGAPRHLTGILLGLGAAVFYAAVVLINKRIQTVEGLPRTLLQFAAAAAVLLPYVLCTGGVTLGTLNTAGWLNLFLLGLCHTGVAYVLYFSSLRSLPGRTAALLSYIDPLVAVLVSVTLLGETLSPWQAAGGLMILGFTLWSELSPQP